MNGRVAAVLGVGLGLAAALARRFAGERFAVAMMSRREESLAEI
jgi:short-subunit dehydrogenase